MLSDAEDFLPRLAKPNANVLEHITKFHTVNGITSNELSPVLLVDYVEQCYSIAFALRVILANFPSWTLVDTHRKPFTRDTDFNSLTKECLAHIQAPSVLVPAQRRSIDVPKPTPPIPKSHLFSIDTTPRKNKQAKRAREGDSGPKVETSPPPKKSKKLSS